jgi:opacity protein-like surface antigen
MKQKYLLLTLSLLVATISLVQAAAAQYAKPTASQPRQFSVFAGVTGDYTGLSGGRNLSLTVAADYAFAPSLGLRPTLEARGTIPSIDKGNVFAQKEGMGGLRVDFLLGHRFHPYVDYLFGRGQMNYIGASGFLYNGAYQQLFTSFVSSPGGGLEIDVREHIVIRIDGQVQQWKNKNVPTESGEIESKLATVGVVYRFGRSTLP